MPRGSSYKGEIILGEPEIVDLPKTDLTTWLDTLRKVDETIRPVDPATKERIKRSVRAASFTVPTAAITTTRSRFRQASEELGISCSIEEEKVDESSTRLLLSTAVRRARRSKEEVLAAKAAAEAKKATEPQQPTGLPTMPASADKANPPIGLPKPKNKAS